MCVRVCVRVYMCEGEYLSAEVTRLAMVRLQVWPACLSPDVLASIPQLEKLKLLAAILQSRSWQKVES